MRKNVTICAPFRDSANTLHCFIDSVTALDYNIERLRVITVEGDSQDNTPGLLQEWANHQPHIKLTTCNTGTPRYGSVVHPERFAVLAQVFNTALNAVDLEWSDYVLFTPSDVNFGKDTLTRLVEHDKDIISPFFWDKHEIFHDVWGFVQNGNQFRKFHRSDVESLYGNTPFEMDTVGGMALIKAQVLKEGCRYTTEEVDRGLCKMARSKGFSVWADPTTHIVHV